jgi:uncharacterized membrane protein
MIIETSDGYGNIISRVDDGREAEPEPVSPELIAAQQIRAAIAESIIGATTVAELQEAILAGLGAAVSSLGGEL